MLLSSSADAFKKFSYFKKKSFRNTIKVLNHLDPDQDRHSVGRDLDLNCLQRFSADNKGRCVHGKRYSLFEFID